MGAAMGATRLHTTSGRLQDELAAAFKLRLGTIFALPLRPSMGVIHRSLNYPVESDRAAYWSLLARLGVIPWSLVAHTNSRLKTLTNRLRDQTPNCGAASCKP